MKARRLHLAFDWVHTHQVNGDLGFVIKSLIILRFYLFYIFNFLANNHESLNYTLLSRAARVMNEL